MDSALNKRMKKIVINTSGTQALKNTTEYLPCMQGDMWILEDQRESMTQRRLQSSALVPRNSTVSPHFHNKGLCSDIAFMHTPLFGFTYLVQQVFKCFLCDFVHPLQSHFM